MPQTPSNAAEFISQHSHAEFRHKAELFALLADEDSITSDSSVVPCALLISIYRSRLDHLQRYDTPHAIALRDDVAALCDALAKISGTHCRIWNFPAPPNSDYTVFEEVDSGGILGCVFAKDKRLTPADEWDNLWREDNRASDGAA